MSPDRDTPGLKELHIYHESDRSSTATITRAYFTDTLVARMLDQVIRPALIELAPKEIEIRAIYGYPHYLAVHWLRTEVILGTKEQHDLEDSIKSIVDKVLYGAFGWNASVIRDLGSFAEVQRKSAELKVNWSTGQRAL